jgi:hypothetical protein
MQKVLIFSIIEAVYIVYMLNYFKSKYSFAHPLSDFKDSYFKHPIGISDKPISNICEFGHQASWLLALFILLRLAFLKNKYTKYISIFVLIVSGTFALLNVNAIIYLIPYFIYEIVLIKNNFKL